MRSKIIVSKPGCKRIFTLFLCTVLAVASCLAFYPVNARTVQAINVKTVTGLGTGTISDPSSAAGGWDYVYFGSSSSDIRFRVLDTNATEFGGNTMLLDCDTTLLTSPQDSTDPYTYGSSGWTNGSVKSVLEGTVLNMFTAQEIAAISRSYKAAPAAGDGEAWDVLEFVPLTGEKLFVLDAAEITRASYGYADCDARDDNRVKTGAESWYWLRSPYTTSNNVCASINPHGDVDGSEPYCPVGVSPALNIDLNSIIFTSSVGAGEYKLTIRDADLGIGITSGSSVTVEGNNVTVPYTITGSHASEATQVTVLIMDSEYSSGVAATSGFTYIPLSVSAWGTSGTGEFTLPDRYLDLSAGSDYYVYLLAEDINDTYRTDYASAPVAIMGTSEPAPVSDPESEPESDPESEPEDTYDLKDVRNALGNVIKAGGEQSVVISGYPTLSCDILELLQANPQITLISEFTYQGVEFRITIPGSAVQADPDIPWCGPLYLYPRFYMYGDPSPDLETYLATFS